MFKAAKNSRVKRKTNRRYSRQRRSRMNNKSKRRTSRKLSLRRNNLKKRNTLKKRNKISSLRKQTKSKRVNKYRRKTLKKIRGGAQLFGKKLKDINIGDIIDNYDSENNIDKVIVTKIYNSGNGYNYELTTTNDGKTIMNNDQVGLLSKKGPGTAFSNLLNNNVRNTDRGIVIALDLTGRGDRGEDINKYRLFEEVMEPEAGKIFHIKISYAERNRVFNNKVVDFELVGSDTMGVTRFDILDELATRKVLEVQDIGGVYVVQKKPTIIDYRVEVIQHTEPEEPEQSPVNQSSVNKSSEMPKFQPSPIRGRRMSASFSVGDIIKIDDKKYIITGVLEESGEVKYSYTDTNQGDPPNRLVISEIDLRNPQIQKEVGSAFSNFLNKKIKGRGRKEIRIDQRFLGDPGWQAGGQAPTLIAIERYKLFDRLICRTSVSPYPYSAAEIDYSTSGRMGGSTLDQTTVENPLGVTNLDILNRLAEKDLLRVTDSDTNTGSKIYDIKFKEKISKYAVKCKNNMGKSGKVDNLETAVKFTADENLAIVMREVAALAANLTPGQKQSVTNLIERYCNDGGQSSFRSTESDTDPRAQIMGKYFLDSSKNPVPYIDEGQFETQFDERRGDDLFPDDETVSDWSDEFSSTDSTVSDSTASTVSDSTASTVSDVLSRTDTNNSDDSDDSTDSDDSNASRASTASTVSNASSDSSNSASLAPTASSNSASLAPTVSNASRASTVSNASRASTAAPTASDDAVPPLQQDVFDTATMKTAAAEALNKKRETCIEEANKKRTAFLKNRERKKCEKNFLKQVEQLNSQRTIPANQ